MRNGLAVALGGAANPERILLGKSNQILSQIAQLLTITSASSLDAAVILTPTTARLKLQVIILLRNFTTIYNALQEKSSSCTQLGWRDKASLRAALQTRNLNSFPQCQPLCANQTPLRWMVGFQATLSLLWVCKAIPVQQLSAYSQGDCIQGTLKLIYSQASLLSKLVKQIANACSKPQAWFDHGSAYAWTRLSPNQGKLCWFNGRRYL